MKKLIFTLMFVAILSAPVMVNAGELSTYTDKNGKKRIDWKSADTTALGKTSDQAAKEAANAMGNTIGAPNAQ